MDDNRDNRAPSHEKAGVPLAKLVADLPEIYQPIFDHPEFSLQASRGCEDRLVHITRVYKAMESVLNRPLRVLDLGCAQGFFSLGLARLGAVVVGVDFQIPNIAVCNALAAEHPDFKAEFKVEFIEDVIGRLEHDRYDLVLGLSLFHHLVHRVGIDLVQKMLTILAHQAAAGIFEMALASEPPAWAASQPKNPKALLSGYAFVHELGRSKSHLSATDRPLYIASNRYWFLNDRICSFDAVKTQSHAFADANVKKTRRYFFGNGLVAKLFSLDPPECGKVNIWEHSNEIIFLSAPPPGFHAPKLLLHGRHEREAWLVREQLPGELLLDRISAGKPPDAGVVMQDILAQLAALESAGLYHNDARTWNILIGPDGHATLIDYGAITMETNDCEWPRNVFLSFMILAHEILHVDAAKPFSFRADALNPDAFPEPYRAAFWDMLKSPLDAWSFAKLRDRLSEEAHGDQILPVPSCEGLSLIIRTMGESCSAYRDKIQALLRRPAQSTDRADVPEVK